mgnify:CR=1 FL=1
MTLLHRRTLIASAALLIAAAKLKQNMDRR